MTIEKQRDGHSALVKYVLEALYDRDKGYAKPRQTTIGHQCPGSATTMYPTTQYARIFPSLWEKVSAERVKPSVRKVGMFSACQAVNSLTGIKDILDQVYGADYADALMDFAMYSIIHHMNEASAFSCRMGQELTYSKEPHSDSFYSRLFEEGMPKDLELLFRRRWAIRCREDGDDTVWLCIDGSNDDCHSTGVEIGEKGHAKSGKDTNIVSFTYAVTPEGKPVTYDVYRGGLVDAKAMRAVLDFLRDCGIRVAGVILDRGYCNAGALRYLAGQGLSYVIMVKGAPEGYEKMVEECARKIKMNAEFLIPHTFLFACQQPVRLFRDYDHQDYLTLFFDYRNAGERVTALLKNLYTEMDRIEGCIRKGGRPDVDKKYRKLLLVSESDPPQVTVNPKELQAMMDEKGLYGIVTSSEMTPREVHELYVSRSASETQYRLIRTQLGYGTIRVSCTAGVRARFSAGFLASILQYEIEKAARELGRNANRMVCELERVEAQKLNDVYTYSHVENERLKKFFHLLQADAEELIEESIRFENDRLAGRVPAPRHRKTGPKKGTHRKKYDTEGNEIPRKSGVPKGTKRKEVNQDGTLRKRPGVQPGTKRGQYNKDGSLRKKPGPKPKTGVSQESDSP